MHLLCDCDFDQADHIEQPQEEECFVSVNAGVPERKHLDGCGQRRSQGHYPIRWVVAVPAVVSCRAACDLCLCAPASQRSSVFLRPRPQRVDVSSGPRLSHQGVSHLCRGRQFRQ